jgi:NAD(P) transhydrogenase subunit alpha
MQLAIAKEPARGETRVALVPESVKKLIAAGYAVAVESGAGTAAHFSDEAYRNAGATVSGDAKAMVAASDILLAIGPPSGETIASLKAGAIVIASLFPTRNLPTVRALAERSVTSFSTDAIPRTTRAQAMDTLSSMANIAGYRGALIAAHGAVQVHAHVHDRRRHDPAREGLRHRRGRRWPAGHRDVQAPRRPDVWATDVRPR